MCASTPLGEEERQFRCQGFLSLLFRCHGGLKSKLFRLQCAGISNLTRKDSRGIIRHREGTNESHGRSKVEFGISATKSYRANPRHYCAAYTLLNTSHLANQDPFGGMRRCGAEKSPLIGPCSGDRPAWPRRICPGSSQPICPLTDLSQPHPGKSARFHL